MAGILLYFRTAWAWDRIVWGESVGKTGELLKNKLKSVGWIGKFLTVRA
jgi:hypothetical protein